MKLKEGHFYKINDRGTIRIGQYAGRDDFDCCVCHFGGHCRIFNFFHNDWDWETAGYGAAHFPEILEDMGEETIIDS